MDRIEEIRARLASLGNIAIAEKSKNYLKSPYSFYGIRIPELRKIAKNYKNLDLCSIQNLFDELWNSENHEEMSFALFLLSQKKKYDAETWNFLMQRIEKAKTWDHIDELSSHILGEILVRNFSLAAEIKKMAESKNSWIKRASIVSTYQLIKKKKIELTILLAEKLAYDNDIYVQKGAGWMLREAGKRDRLAVRNFILSHLNMGNYAFSYATEKMLELRRIRKEKSKNDKY